jgi:cytochrome c oxidase subunit IV
MKEMNTRETNDGNLASCFLVYGFVLATSLLQIVIAYENIEDSQRFVRMLLLAIAQAAGAILFFMRGRSEKRSLALFLLPATVFVLAMMNMFWADSFRLLNMRPFAH